MSVRVALLSATLACVGSDVQAQGALTAPANNPGGRPPACQTNGTACQATRVFDFLDSIGVNVHLDSYGDTPYGEPANGGTTGAGANTVNGRVSNVSKIAAALNWMGIHHVRQISGDPGGASNYRMNNLQALVPSLNAVFAIDNGPPYQFTTATVNSYVANIGGVVPISIVEAIEAPNEFQGFNKTYNGAGGAAAVCQLITDMTPGVNARLNALGVQRLRLAPSVGGDNDFAGKQACRALSTSGNGHPYAWSGAPMSNVITEYVKDISDAVVGSTSNWATEMGISSAPGLANSVDIATEAKQNLNQLLDMRDIGYTRSFLYEEVDENQNSGIEAHFGQYDSNWVAKPSGTALHNQAVILSDPACPYSSTSQPSCLATAAATFTPGSLAYTLTNAPNNTYSMLMQRSDGAFILAVWGDIFAYNQSSNTPVNTPSTTVTVGFPSMTSITVTDPMVDANPTTLPAGTSAQIQISDHPVYLTMAATGGGGGAAVRGACTFGGGSL